VNLPELQEEIAVELENMELVVRELAALRGDLAGRAPTVRERTAAAAFLAQFYNGVENLLKRLSRFHGVPLPTGDNWHVALFKRFCAPPHEPLPALCDGTLAARLGAFRKFRHVVHRGYGFQLEWERMAEGVNSVDQVFSEIKARLREHLATLKPSQEGESPPT